MPSWAELATDFHVLGPLCGAPRTDGPPAPRTDGPAAPAHGEGLGPGPGPAHEGIDSCSAQEGINSKGNIIDI